MPQTSVATLRADCLSDAQSLREATRLYTEVFGYQDPDYALNPNLLVALGKNGGSVVGVYAADQLVGFAYGFAGRDAVGNDFHYSQAAVVRAGFQGQGVGRLLKQRQREVALSVGHRAMRWTFDPVLSRNAHFNLSSLQAEAIAYEPDYYGRGGTDRLLVEWALDRHADPYATDRDRVPPALGPLDWGRSTRGEDGAVWIALPVDASAVGIPGHVGAALRDALTETLRSGRVLTSCQRIDETTSAYLAVPRAAAEATTPPHEGSTP